MLRITLPPGQTLPEFLDEHFPGPIAPGMDAYARGCGQDIVVEDERGRRRLAWCCKPTLAGEGLCPEHVEMFEHNREVQAWGWYFVRMLHSG